MDNEPRAQAVYRRIVLVRHAHYKQLPSRDDGSLTALGRVQAARLGERLASLRDCFVREPLEGLYASDWPRASQTAMIVGKAMRFDPVEIRPSLREILPSLHRDLSSMDVMGLERTHLKHDLECVYEEFFSPPTRNGIVVIVTHANLIRCLIAEVLQLPIHAWIRMEVFHASMSEVRVYPNGYAVLTQLSDVGHLSADMISIT